ncbi:CNH domain-containing protein [Phycomyces blakesleeanus]
MIPQHSKPVSEPPGSPALEALYQDLDSFINELAGELPDSLDHCNKKMTLNFDESSELDSIAKYVKDSEQSDSWCSDHDDTVYARSSITDSMQESIEPKPKPLKSTSEETSWRKPSIQLERESSETDDDGYESEEYRWTPHLKNDNSSTFRSDNSLSPPISPSLLGITQPRSFTLASRETEQSGTSSQSLSQVRKFTRKIGTPQTGIFTIRSSSLNRQASESSVRSGGFLPSLRSNHKGFTTPTSPLAMNVRMGTYEPLLSGNETSIQMTFPHYAFFSELGENFVSKVISLTETRRIFSSTEYPNSFTGAEAVFIIRILLPTGLPEGLYSKVARALMHIKPPLIIPLAYSEKSQRRNTLYNSSSEVYDLVEETIQQGIPQGIYTPLTPCYTNTCLPGQGGCYSYSCPNRDIDMSDTSDKSEKSGGLKRRDSAASSKASSYDATLSRAWSATVAKEVLQSTPSAEIGRQEAIHEIIYTEEDYVRDLKLLDELYAQPLRIAPCIAEDYREEFCDNVFNNYLELLDLHTKLYQDLRDHQSLCQSQDNSGFVDRVGDIFLRHLPGFMALYSRYGPHVVLAEYAIKKETQDNILFQNFIQNTERKEECRKLPFRHFIILPVTRLQRYPLLVGAILKKTPEDHPDKKDLLECSNMLKAIANKMDSETANTKMTLRIYQINDHIRYKTGEPHDLQLTKKGRKLLYEGILTRRSHMVVESTELRVFLFDHMLLMTRERKGNDGEDEYQISKRPIPMELLHVQEATEGFSIGLRSMASTYPNATSPGLNLGTSFGSHFPILIHHLGRLGGDHLMYAESAEARMKWKHKIVEAKIAMEKANSDREVFTIRSLRDASFIGSTGIGSGANHGKVTCSVPFLGATGFQMIAVGTVSGIWMGMEGDTNDMQQVLSLQDVCQIAVLEEEHILMVLADKTLIAYSLGALDPKSPHKTNEKPNQKVAQHISYFNAGVCNNRTLVIAMKKRGTDSHFKAFEPTCGDLRNPSNAKYLTTKTGFFSKAPSWFKIYKEFYIGTDSFAVHFLKARVVVVCSRGFEIIDLEQLNLNRNLPDLNNPAFEFVQIRGEDVRPLAMFRCKDHYLLCYNEFAFRVDNHGSFIEENYSCLTWEGDPQAVAFCYPYVVGFDSRFVEVRDVITGELVQTLAGEHMRCLQFSSDALTPIIHGCMVHPFKPDYQYIFQLQAKFAPTL